MNNEEMYKKYSKLVYFIIHRWSTKPKGYCFDIEDVALNVWTVLFGIPVHSTKRTNRNYVSFVIQTTLSSEFKKLNKINNHENYEYNEFLLNKEIPILETQEELENEFVSLVKLIFDNTLNIDEKICVACHFRFGYIKTYFTAKKISFLIFKTEKETKDILNNALEKIRIELQRNSIISKRTLHDGRTHPAIDYKQE